MIYYFDGVDLGGKRTATLYGLIGRAKTSNVDPLRSAFFTARRGRLTLRLLRLPMSD
jgi:hypothetical protein